MKKLFIVLIIFIGLSIDIYATDTTGPIVTNVTIDKQGQTLKAGDVITLTVNITEESGILTLQLPFSSEESGASVNMNASNLTHQENGVYTISYTINESMNFGKWYLGSIFVMDEYNISGTNSVSNLNGIYFYVDSGTTDTTGPIVTNVTIDKQGQTLKAGDVVTLTVNITEESGILTLQLPFSSEESGASVNMNASNLTHQENGVYTISYTINESMNVGKWYLGSIFVMDEYNISGTNSVTNLNGIYFYVMDNIAPIISIENYPLNPTNENIAVIASTNEGTLNTASHTFTANGSFDFIATDAAGNVTTKTVTITNIDKLLPVVKVIYQTHVQDIDWQKPVSDGAMSGTSGQALRLEAINIQVTGNPNLGITYSTHVQNIGWQTSVSNGVNSGTLGQSLRLEAIKIELTGSDAINYDVYYRVHAQNFGWLDWAMNGKAAGTEGYSYRLEAINIIIVPKGKDMGYATIRPFVSVIGTSKVTYRTHVQNVGWQAIVKDGAMSGTSGQSLRLEGIEIKLGPNMPSGSITYATHVQDYGWMTPVSDGAMSGTSGQTKRLEAIQISLSGEVSAQYDVYYRVHAQNFGWLDWAMNGASAGTAGYGYRLEAIEIVMVLKGGAAPGSTTRPFIQK